MDGKISQNKDDIRHLLDMLSYELAPFYNINRKYPLYSMGISVPPDFRPPGSDFRPPGTKIRPQGSEIRPPILRNSDMTSMPKIQTDITDYASEILFLKYCVVPQLFKIISYLANFRGPISDPLGLILVSRGLKSDP